MPANSSDLADPTRAPSHSAPVTVGNTGGHRSPVVVAGPSYGSAVTR